MCQQSTKEPRRIYLFHNASAFCVECTVCQEGEGTPQYLCMWVGCLGCTAAPVASESVRGQLEYAMH